MELLTSGTKPQGFSSYPEPIRLLSVYLSVHYFNIGDLLNVGPYSTKFILPIPGTRSSKSDTIVIMNIPRIIMEHPNLPTIHIASYVKTANSHN